MGNQNVERPQGLKASRPAPALDTSLAKGADWDPQPNAGQFKSQAPLVKKPSTMDDPNAVMNFKSASSNPHDMPLPLGHSYGDFPATTASDSDPRARFQDKVDTRKIMKGNPATAQDTGTAHS